MKTNRTKMWWLLGLALLLSLLAGLSTSAQAAPDEPAATCTTPYTDTIRGKQVQWDQCYLHEFSHDGTDYAVRVYYTEAFNPDPADFNYSQCAPDEDPDTRCEHAIPDNDDVNGDNVQAVTLAQESESALRFYVDHDLSPLPQNGTDFYVYIAEDPKNGWIVEPDGIITDDEKATDDVMGIRWNVYHEMQHLIQRKYYDGNWALWWTEGLARTVEDRVDVALDGAIEAFITDSRRMLRNSADHDFPRHNDLLDAKYRAVVWWTWVLDQYRDAGETAPALGWLALQDFYDEIATGVDSLIAADNFLHDQGSSFQADFIDYTLAMYAYQYSPADARLGFLDTELINETSLQNHAVIDFLAPWIEQSVQVQPRSSRYWEFSDASQCDYIAFEFDANSKYYAYSLLTVDNNTLQSRWTMYTNAWARAVRSTELERVAGVLTAVNNQGLVDVSYGCVEPQVTILNPTTTAFKMVGTADNPRQFIVQLEVVAANDAPVAGLVPDAFSVEIQKAGDPSIEAEVINALYVQDDYWLLVQAPDDAAGAETGNFYHLTVNLDDYDSDTQNNALLYVEQVQDKVIVLDRSGSMGDDGKLGAAQNAASLMVNELSDDDQGGYVAFDEDAYLRQGLNGMDAGNHRTDLETAIAAETPGGQTSIGDGLKQAAQEHDAKGIATNACTFVLLSDGYENAEAYWADVQAGVVDNGCGLNVVGLGPQANEDLLQQIAGAAANGGGLLNAPTSAGGPGYGSYDYAPDSGDVSFASAAGSNSVGWENYLSRIYDYAATRAAGRQRIYSTAFNPTLNGPTAESYDLVVDETTDELVIAIAWQVPNTAPPSRLFRPGGDEVDPSYSRISSQFTNQVWRVPNPEAGTWQLDVLGLFSEYYVSASALTDLQLHLFTGGGVADAYPGMQVPILASFVNLGQPVLEATVWAQVIAPSGAQKTVVLYDDGAHGDTLADDGVYGGYYSLTSLGELVPDDPQSYDDGQEPSSAGSYTVNAIGKWNGHVREAQGGFALQQAPDSDGDGLPDPYEEDNGLDPDDPTDAGKDQDGDGLTVRCEIQLGTDPWNSDTDNGGEGDGSEVPGCLPGDQDPLDPSDDRTRTVWGLQVRPEASASGQLSVTLTPVGHGPWMTDVIVYRQTVDDEHRDWIILDSFSWPCASCEDTTVEDGVSYRYRLVPLSLGEGSNGLLYQGAAVESRVVQVKADPYPPGGSIIIDDGARTTSQPTVTLSLIADDLGPDHGNFPTGNRPGDKPGDLMMRLSNDDDFEGTAWQPYQTRVEGWGLGDVEPGDQVMVYVQFKDTSDNVGASGLGMVDAIIYQPHVIYLPIVVRTP